MSRVWGRIAPAGLATIVIVGVGIAMFSLFNKKPAAPEPTAQPEPGASRRADVYDEAERRALLTLARRALTQVVTEGTLPALPDDLPAKLREERGCFVTLEKDHQLRGCIGHIFPKEPLALAIIDNARNAALRDTRFSPVTPDELAAIEIEISVLTEPQALAFTSPEDLLAKLRPHVDGVVLEIHGRRSTFLPQVWEKLPDKERFLDHLAAKAGNQPAAWRGRGVSVQTYQAEAFTEPELGLP